MEQERRKVLILHIKTESRLSNGHTGARLPAWRNAIVKHPTCVQCCLKSGVYCQFLFLSPTIMLSKKWMGLQNSHLEPYFPTWFSLVHQRHHEVSILKPNWCNNTFSCPIVSRQIDAAAITSRLAVCSPGSADPFLGWSHLTLWSCQRKRNCWVKWPQLSCCCAASVCCGNLRSVVIRVSSLSRYVYFRVDKASVAGPAQGLDLLNCSLSISSIQILYIIPVIKTHIFLLNWVKLWPRNVPPTPYTHISRACRLGNQLHSAHAAVLRSGDKDTCRVSVVIHLPHGSIFKEKYCNVGPWELM